MTLEQGFAFAIVLGTIGLLIWGRIRYDLVAMLALLAAIACGIVTPKDAFRGFSDDIVIIVGSALVVSAAISRSGLVETLMKPLVPRMQTSVMQVAVLGSAVTALSAFIKNIGALAIFIPIALQVARRTGKPASRVLMPLAFGSLLGGLITLIGTSPNVIVSRMRAQITGEPFHMFDFAPVGLGLAVVGVIFLTFGWRLLPKIKRGAGGTPETRFSVEDYITEARLPPDSPYAGRTVRDLEALGDGDVTVAAIIRENRRRYIPAGFWPLFAGDILVLKADTHALSKLVDAATLELIHRKELVPGDAREDDLAVVEAVVTANSPMIGSTVEQLALRERYGLNLLALSRSGRRIAQRLRRVRFQEGDLLVLQGREERRNDKLTALGCLPLAERNVPLGRTRNLYLPAVVLGIALILVTTEAVTVPVGFFAAAVVMLALQLLTLKEAYEAVEWPVLVLFGALIPVSEALQTTGATALVASWLSAAAQHLPPLGALGMTLLAAMALTPFLNNAATVLVMAPIGASLARAAGSASGPVPDGGRSRRRLRLPDAHRAPVQHARHGPRRLPLRRLLAPRPAAISDRRRSRDLAHQLVLAPHLNTRCRAPPSLPPPEPRFAWTPCGNTARGSLGRQVGFGVDLDGGCHPGHEHHAVGHLIDLDPHRNALGKTHPGENRVDRRDPLRVRLRVRDVDAAREAADVAGQDLAVAHQLDPRRVAHLDLADVGLLEITVHPEGIGIDHGDLGLPDGGVVAQPRQQIGHPAVDRRADLRAFEVDPRPLQVGLGLLVLCLGRDRVGRVDLWSSTLTASTLSRSRRLASLSAFCALARACCTAASARLTMIR